MAHYFPGEIRIVNIPADLLEDFAELSSTGAKARRL